MTKRIVSLFLASVMLVGLFGCSKAKPTSAKKVKKEDKVITDLIGREVKVPANPKKIAAMTGPAYEMVFMLGGKDQIKMVKQGHTKNYPIALLTNPDLKNYEGIDDVNPSAVVNVEEYMSRDVDLVMYYSNKAELKKFDDVKLPAVVLTLNKKNDQTVEEVLKTPVDKYINKTVKPLKLLSGILGGQAPDKYKKWEKYTSEKINFLNERTKDLKDSEKPTIYWGNTWGENILSSYILTNRCYEMNLCGAKLVGPKDGGNFPKVTNEALYKWNPDIILIDNHGNSPDKVQKQLETDKKWNSLKAVKNDKLHRIPAGVFFMDKGTTTALMLLWVATIAQPELFKDVDMIEEIQYYYKNFYDYNLSKDEATKIINGWYDEVGA